MSVEFPVSRRGAMRSVEGSRPALEPRLAAVARRAGAVILGRSTVGRSLRALIVCAAMSAWAFSAGQASITAHTKPRGHMVDIGGRRLRLVCEGPADSGRPVVLFESGAFGFSGDWANVQSQLTTKGVRSCAYDRAGMGLSDRAASPRDGVNVAKDLETLLAVAHVPGPYILVGHSMAGARVHLFANRNPDKVAGLVLVDSTTPDATFDPEVAKYVADFTAETHLAARVAQFGILKLLASTPLADKVGLPPEEDAEKRRQFASASYNANAFEEVSYWPLAARQAQATGPLNPKWPVAVVSAGVFDTGEGPQMQALQPPPALASEHGYVVVAHGATHNGLLGATYSTFIVKGIDFVLGAASHSHETAQVAALR